MKHWLSEWLEEWLPLAALSSAAGALVGVVAWLYRRMRWATERLRTLGVSVRNLHKERAERRAQSLRVPAPTRSPPPLSEARTLHITEEMLLTQVALSKERKPMATKPSELDPCVAGDQLALILRACLGSEPLPAELRQTLWRLLPYYEAIRHVSEQEPQAVRAIWWRQLLDRETAPPPPRGSHAES